MVFSPETIEKVESFTDIKELKIYIKDIMGINFSWIEQINNINLLKRIIINDYYKAIDNSLYLDLDSTLNNIAEIISKIPRYIIRELFKFNIYNKGQHDRFHKIKIIKKQK